MDWIERWFGVSPDHGDGSLEILIVLTVIVAVAVILVALHPRGRRTVLRWLLRSSAKIDALRER